ncbi:SusC/RagA family TonB-linked outer membrane protein [Gaoshiqia sp. Z1-71]|uniref:SusC/RagA family TonB-linked outer membrane protein n=1 Tax=Gaoshiqia hydrogeniformans TaxID=3290090 RepID=UPI003BF83706
MKLTLSLLLVSIISMATGAYSQTARINLKVSESTIIEIFRQIEETSNVGFFFKNDQLDLTRKYTVNFENSTVEDILDTLLGDGYSYRYIGKNVVITANDPSVNPSSLQQQQKRTVNGKVTNTQGEPIPGVTVIVKGTTIGTITDFDGSFSVANVSGDETLVFSFVGMRSQEVPVDNRSNFQVVLEEETIGVGEVIVTALGVRREEKALGYAVQKVAGESLATVKGVDMGTSLTGKVAGLLVKNSSEFTAAPEIQLRGETPLLVIDGVPYEYMTLRDVPSDDIENISVLKGATASALYGFKGQGGAIMVTTKKGSGKKGLSVSVNSGTMFTAGYLAIPETQSTFGRVVNTATNQYVGSGDGAWGPPMEGQQVIQWDPVSKTYQSMPYLPIGKNNFENFVEQGYILNNNISVVQQGEYGSLRSSATWVRNKGNYPNSMFDKITYSLGGDMKLNKFTLSSTLSYNKQTSPNVGFSGYTGYDPMYNILVWAAPDYDIRQYKDYWLVKNESQNSSFTSINNNPYFDRHERIHSVDRDIFNGTVALTYDFTPWLKATFRSGFDTYSDRQVVRVSMGSFQGGGTSTVIKNGTQIWGESKKGSYNTGIGRGYSINNDFILSGDRKFGDFTLDALFGGTMNYIQDEGIEARTQAGLSIPGYYSLKASVNPVAVSSRIYKRQVNSLFGRLSLSWNNMVFVEGTLRNDWSSTLAKSERSYLYPSVATSFIVSELLPETDWLSLWKVRGSWTTARKPSDIYEINSVYSITNNAWGNMSSAAYPSTIRGTDVHAEGSETYEIGTIVSVLQNRASVDFAYYNHRIYDKIVSAPISPASGFYSNYINTDEEITRRGVELTANVTPVKTNDWKWDLSFNWTKYARYYTKLDDEFSVDKPWVKVGERADHYILNDFQKDPNGQLIHSAGLPLYSPYTSVFGYSDPDWIWGLATSLRYKNFTFNMSVDGRVGGLAQTTTEMYMWLSGNHPKSVTNERYLDATQPGTSNYLGEGVKVVSGAATYDTYGNITSDTRQYATNDEKVTYKNYIARIHKGTAWGGSPSPLDAYSTTFFKIREMSVTYDVPLRICSLIHAKGASVSAIGQNVLLWAKQFKYSDPDGGTENFIDPAQRYLGVNLKVTF